MNKTAAQLAAAALFTATIATVPANAEAAAALATATVHIAAKKQSED